MLTDNEFRQLKYLADAKDMPLGTVAYRFVTKGLRGIKTLNRGSRAYERRGH